MFLVCQLPVAGFSIMCGHKDVLFWLRTKYNLAIWTNRVALFKSGIPLSPKVSVAACATETRPGVDAT